MTIVSNNFRRISTEEIIENRADVIHHTPGALRSRFLDRGLNARAA